MEGADPTPDLLHHTRQPSLPSRDPAPPTLKSPALAEDLLTVSEATSPRLPIPGNFFGVLPNLFGGGNNQAVEGSDEHFNLQFGEEEEESQGGGWNLDF